MGAELQLFENLDDAARRAGGALSREARPWLFDRLDWFRLVTRHTPPADGICVIHASEGDARAWLFLARDGRRAESLSNWYCLRTGPVMDGPAPVAALVKGLRRAGIARLFLKPIAQGDPLPPALRKAGWLVSTSAVNCSWRVPVKGLSFEDYWAGRPSRLRNTVRRRAKTPGLTLTVHTRFDAAAWADYEAVYEASWKPPEGSPALIRELAEQEGAAGTLRLGLAYLDGRPVAAQLWLVENGVATIHKLAYAEDAKQVAPGTVLSAEMFRRAIDVDKVDLIDFGIGDDPYKREWMTEREPLYQMVAYDLLSPFGLAALARAAFSRLVRRRRND